MTLSRAAPLLILVLLVGGITFVFLRQEPGGEQASVQAGPLIRLSPVLRGLAESGADGEVAARATVDRVLEQYTEDPREVILEALRSRDFGARWAGLLAIPRYGESDAALVDALVQLLDAQSPRVRATAATAAGYVGTGFGALEPGLVGASHDPLPEVRAAALRTLARRSARHPELIDLFTAALADVDAACRAQGARGLAQVELQERLEVPALTRVRAALVGALGDRSREVRMYAVMALGRAGPAAGPDVPAILPLLRDDDPLVNGQAASALGSIGAAALPAIEDALASGPLSLAPSLLWALHLMGEPAVALLVRTLSHGRALVRVLGAQKLIEMERETGRAVPVVVAALASQDRAVLKAAIRVIERMGTASAEAVGRLDRLASHEDEAIAHAAAGAAKRQRALLERK